MILWVFRVSKVRENLPQEMDEQAREEFFRVKKAHRVALCAKVTFCLVKSGERSSKRRRSKCRRRRLNTGRVPRKSRGWDKMS